ncbi:Uncharacterised protein [Alloiococcus otitis]|nr:Uncharacterised protein [Alloiococcus otitis]
MVFNHVTSVIYATIKSRTKNIRLREHIDFIRAKKYC